MGCTLGKEKLLQSWDLDTMGDLARKVASFFLDVATCGGSVGQNGAFIAFLVGSLAWLAAWHAILEFALYICFDLDSSCHFVHCLFALIRLSLSKRK